MKALGDYCGGVPPLPIPNREVKTASADGTAQQLWKSRSSPFFKTLHSFTGMEGFFLEQLSPQVLLFLYHPTLTTNTQGNQTKHAENNVGNTLCRMVVTSLRSLLP